MMHFQDNFYLTCDRISVVFDIIYMDLSFEFLNTLTDC